jgi:hypothetical protein
MTENLFKFPIILIDGSKEEEKEELSRLTGKDPDDDEADLIYAEQECPYWDFLSVGDRWLPTEESYQRALIRKFDACSVSFSRCGNFVVPWSKEKFKKKLSEFIDSVPKSKENLTILPIKEELLAKLNSQGYATNED